MDASLQQRAEQLATEFAGQARTAEDLNGLLRLMMKSALERMLNAELDVHLGRRPLPQEMAAAGPLEETPTAATLPPRKPNRRNGKSPKTVQDDLGEVTIDTPRDRDGTFEPVLIPKHQRRVPGFDEKILALYAKGMTTRDIQQIVQELYGVEVSPTLISEITADVDAEVTTWRTRSLEAVWPIVYFDGIVVHVRGSSGRVSQHTVYVALGVNLEGKKELLGLWLAETEGARFWLSCLTDLQSRGLTDIFVACIDGLSGFAEAIHAAYPQTKVQLCLVHLVRAALRYVSTQDSQAVARDLKKIYQSSTVLEAEQALASFAQAWEAKYPTIAKMWRAKWSDIIPLFDFPPAIRKAIYTTNAIESVNSVIRKFTRNRKIYPSEESALKNVYMAIREAARKWTMPIHHWKQALNHFATFDYNYNSEGYLAGRTLSQGSTTLLNASYGYDWLGRLQYLNETGTASEAKSVEYVYVPFGQDHGGKLSAIQGYQLSTQVVSTVFSYDTKDRLSAISHDGLGHTAALAAYDYTYDTADRLTSITPWLNGTADPAEKRTYSYDALGQLQTATDGASVVKESYAYDANGNRTDHTGGGAHGRTYNGSTERNGRWGNRWNAD